ncbi:MAG: heme biosynthesis protein HemY [Kiloniellaceae bacterium]
MIRVLVFCLKVAVLVALAYWLAERPGAVSIEWLGYRIETSVGILLLAVALVAAAAALVYRFWRVLYRAPRDLGRSLQASRRRRGYKALTQGMVAVAAGEAAEAARWAKRADALLDEPPLTMLLSAQAAQLNGDGAAAKRYFTAMLDNRETRFLGLRGLLTQALRDGDEQAALDYVRQAYALRPSTPWVLTSLFDLSERCGDLDTAERALKDATRARALPAPEAERKRAVLLLERALSARRAGDTGTALRLAREAHKRAPGLAPAAVLVGELLVAAGQRQRAAKVLERAWAAAPHPELVRVYLSARPSQDGLERLKRLARLTAGRPDHPESHLALARAALAAKLWGEARRHLSAAAGPDGLDGAPGEAVCRLMAELEEAEHGDAAAGRAWLTRASEAPQDPAWVCRSCGALCEAWSARCGACGTFDGLAWQRPPRVAPTLIEAEPERRAGPAALPEATTPALPAAAEARASHRAGARGVDGLSVDGPGGLD